MRFIPLFLAFLLCFTAVSSGARAESIKVGSTIPDISAKDQTGKTRSFDSLVGSKGLTLVFLRSVEWCAPCQNQAADLSKSKKEFDTLGYPVVAISYDAVDKLKAFSVKRDISMTLLSDPRSEIIKSFGILNEGVVKGTMAYGTPKPGVYVIGKDKTVKAMFFKDGIQDRPTVKEITAAITAMEKPVEQNFDIDPTAKDAPVTDAMPPEAMPPVAPMPETPAVDLPVTEDGSVMAPPAGLLAPTMDAVPPMPDSGLVPAPEPMMMPADDLSVAPPPSDIVPPADVPANIPSGEFKPAF
jgi:peroxiredoxin